MPHSSLSHAPTIIFHLSFSSFSVSTTRFFLSLLFCLSTLYISVQSQSLSLSISLSSSLSLLSLSLCLCIYIYFSYTNCFWGLSIYAILLFLVITLSQHTPLWHKLFFSLSLSLSVCLCLSLFLINDLWTKNLTFFFDLFQFIQRQRIDCQLAWWPFFWNSLN